MKWQPISDLNAYVNAATDHQQFANNAYLLCIEYEDSVEYEIGWLSWEVANSWVMYTADTEFRQDNHWCTWYLFRKIPLAYWCVIDEVQRERTG